VPRQVIDPTHQGGGLRRGPLRQGERPDANQINTNFHHLELREKLNLAKEKKGVNEKPEEEARKMKCFRCQEMGHHQRGCINTLICYKCKEEGHMAAECADVHSKAGELKMYDFVIPKQGYYSIKIPGGYEPQKVACIVQVLQGEASEKKIEEELRNLINNQRDW
jgi:hypothetical protein